MATKVIEFVSKEDTRTYKLIREALLIYDDYLHSENDIQTVVQVRTIINKLDKLRKERKI